MARFTASPAGSLETSGRRIEVEFPEGFGVTLDAETTGGRVELPGQVRVEGSLGPDHVRGRLNGGGSELQLRTTGGNIRVRLR